MKPDIEAIRERAEKATPTQRAPLHASLIEDGYAEVVAEFLSCSIEDIPALLEHVDRLERALEHVRDERLRMAALIAKLEKVVDDILNHKLNTYEQIREALKQLDGE